MIEMLIPYCVSSCFLANTHSVIVILINYSSYWYQKGPRRTRNENWTDMNGLLIIWFCSSVVGKIHSQETVVSYALNAQSARIPPLDRRPAVVQDINRQLESSAPTRVIEILVQPAGVELYRPQLFDGNSFNLPQSTVRPNQAQRTRLASKRITETMEGTDNSNTLNTPTESPSISMELNKEKPKKLTRPATLPLPTGNETVSSKKSTIAKDLPPTTNVTFDERSSFTGDQCPTGFVKLNGTCVKTDWLLLW